MTSEEKLKKVVEDVEGGNLFQQILNYIEELEDKIQIYDTFAQSKGVYKYSDVKLQARHWLE